jgi:hypothetical protein
MKSTSPYFKDGRIEEVRTTADYVRMKISCAKVESGELIVDVSSNADGWVHLHFSGLGSKKISVDNQFANAVDIFIK